MCSKIVGDLLVTLFRISPSMLFLDSSMNFLKDIPVFSSISFDITKAIKLRILNLMGSSLKWKTGRVCKSLFDLLNACSIL